MASENIPFDPCVPNSEQNPDPVLNSEQAAISPAEENVLQHLLGGEIHCSGCGYAGTSVPHKPGGKLAAVAEFVPGAGGPIRTARTLAAAYYCPNCGEQLSASAIDKAANAVRSAQFGERARAGLKAFLKSPHRSGE